MSAEVLGAASVWDWWYRSDAPSVAWRDVGFDASGWDRGVGVFGWGAPIVVTPIDSFASTPDRARAAYFRSSFEVADVDRVVGLRLDTAGDDGVVVYVNGVEVARDNMRDGVVTHMTYAPSARRYHAAPPVVVEVPRELLRTGTNVVSAETHVNYRATPDMTFSLTATLTVR